MIGMIIFVQQASLEASQTCKSESTESVYTANSFRACELSVQVARSWIVTIQCNKSYVGCMMYILKQLLATSHISAADVLQSAHVISKACSGRLT